MPRPYNTIENVLRRYVDKNGAAPCWLWFGTIAQNGYGKVTFDYVTWSAHKLFYVHFKGLVPDGLQIDHTCNNKLCVNPEHLEAVTSKINMERRATLKTHCIRNHPLSGGNLYVTPDGRRQCRICRSVSEAQYRGGTFFCQ